MIFVGIHTTAAEMQIWQLLELNGLLFLLIIISFFFMLIISDVHRLTTAKFFLRKNVNVSHHYFTDQTHSYTVAHMTENTTPKNYRNLLSP